MGNFAENLNLGNRVPPPPPEASSSNPLTQWSLIPRFYINLVTVMIPLIIVHTILSGDENDVVMILTQ